MACCGAHVGFWPKADKWKHFLPAFSRYNIHNRVLYRPITLTISNLKCLLKDLLQVPEHRR